MATAPPGRDRSVRPPRMRALFLASAVYGLEGGLERFNRRLVRALAELRDEGLLESVLAISMSDTPADEAAAPRDVRLFGGRGSKVRTALWFIWLTFSRRPRVIFYGYVGFAPLAIVARILNPGAVHLLIVHGVEVWRHPPPIRRWATRHCLDAILSVSAFTIDKMSGFFGLRAAMFRVFPNCLDVNGVAPEGEAIGSSPRLQGGHRLVSVTRLSLVDRYKNVDKVILALPRVLDAFPDTHYYIVGEGPWRPDLERLSASTGISERVHFLGRVDDATRDAAYAGADVFVLPSTGEGFGIVFLEAWKFALPCIASNRDAASEVIRDGVDGYCVEPQPRMIADAICSLLAEPEKRKAMGAAGRERLKTKYSHDRFRENLGRILEEFV